jgi:two-component system cell cycle response regulator DivK
MADDILAIDDDELSLRLLEVIFTRLGHTIRTATTADEALAEIRRSPPRLILTDLNLPGMSGLALTRTLKDDPATRDIVIVVVTASAMAGDAERARAAGCDEYVAKPIDRRQLGELVQRYLGP